MKELVIICYMFHKSVYLLRFCNELSSYEPECLRFINNYNSTTSLYDRVHNKILVTFRNENMASFFLLFLIVSYRFSCFFSQILINSFTISIVHVVAKLCSPNHKCMVMPKWWKQSRLTFISVIIAMRSCIHLKPIK
jgi:hypothetical protein